MESLTKIDNQLVQSKIYTVRNTQVMLDRDLAELYGVETKRLNEQVKRNIARFPESFRFQLTKDEFENWKSQIATSNSEKMGLRRASMQQQTPSNAESLNPSKGLLYNHIQQHPSSLVTGSPEAGSNRGVSCFQGGENR